MIFQLVFARLCCIWNSSIPTLTCLCFFPFFCITFLWIKFLKKLQKKIWLTTCMFLDSFHIYTLLESLKISGYTFYSNFGKRHSLKFNYIITIENIDNCHPHQLYTWIKPKTCWHDFTLWASARPLGRSKPATIGMKLGRIKALHSPTNLWNKLDISIKTSYQSGPLF